MPFLQKSLAQKSPRRKGAERGFQRTKGVQKGAERGFYRTKGGAQRAHKGRKKGAQRVLVPPLAPFKQKGGL